MTSPTNLTTTSTRPQTTKIEEGQSKNNHFNLNSLNQIVQKTLNQLNRNVNHLSSNSSNSDGYFSSSPLDSLSANTTSTSPSNCTTISTTNPWLVPITNKDDENGDEDDYGGAKGLNNNDQERRRRRSTDVDHHRPIQSRYSILRRTSSTPSLRKIHKDGQLRGRPTRAESQSPDQDLYHNHNHNHHHHRRITRSRQIGKYIQKRNSSTAPPIEDNSYQTTEMEPELLHQSTQDPSYLANDLSRSEKSRSRNTISPGSPNPQPSKNQRQLGKTSSLKNENTGHHQHRNHQNSNKEQPGGRAVDLEDFPQDQLLKILARLLERITNANNHLKRTGSPATPSSELSRPKRIIRKKPFSNIKTTPVSLSLSSPSSSSTPSASSSTTSSSSSSSPSSSASPISSSSAAAAGATMNGTLAEVRPKRPCKSPTVAQFQQSCKLPMFQTPDDPIHKSSSPNGCLESVVRHHHSNKSFKKNDYYSRRSKGLRGSEEELLTASIELLRSPSSILTFHAKLVPQISIESYLMRILKYCPTSNQVFLSCIIYLDRLSSNLRFNNYYGHQAFNQYSIQNNYQGQQPQQQQQHQQQQQRFVIDSWNVHRYLIACLTASSKFLSDVFYTNSRYAKVGGLPLEELNELEIKFLLMNDFRLMIKLEEMVDYKRRLIDERSNWDREDEEGEDEDEQESNLITSSSSSSSKFSGEDEGKEKSYENRDEEDEEDEDYDEDYEDDDYYYYEEGSNMKNTDECSNTSSSNSERSSCSTVTPYCNTPTVSSSTPNINHGNPNSNGNGNRPMIVVEQDL